jgi:DNA-directed RNA polymerase sigma subunit (sigma70/sigma32)
LLPVAREHGHHGEPEEDAPQPQIRAKCATTKRDIAKRLGVTDQDVIDMNRWLGGDASLNAPTREDGDSGMTG